MYLYLYLNHPRSWGTAATFADPVKSHSPRLSSHVPHFPPPWAFGSSSEKSLLSFEVTYPFLGGGVWLAAQLVSLFHSSSCWWAKILCLFRLTFGEPTGAFVRRVVARVQGLSPSMANWKYEILAKSWGILKFGQQTIFSSNNTNYLLVYMSFTPGFWAISLNILHNEFQIRKAFCAFKAFM